MSRYFFRVLGYIFLPAIFQLTLKKLKYHFPVPSIFFGEKKIKTFVFLQKPLLLKPKPSLLIFEHSFCSNLYKSKQKLLMRINMDNAFKFHYHLEQSCYVL